MGNHRSSYIYPITFTWVTFLEKKKSKLLLLIEWYFFMNNHCFYSSQISGYSIGTVSKFTERRRSNGKEKHTRHTSRLLKENPTVFYSSFCFLMQFYVCWPCCILRWSKYTVSTISCRRKAFLPWSMIYLLVSYCKYWYYNEKKCYFVITAFICLFVLSLKHPNVPISSSFCLSDRIM